MDYKKAYKDALNRAKHALDCHNQGMVSTDVSLITSMFPELKEPEDEKVRKALIEMVHDTPNSECEQNYNVRKEDCLTWLEKQGEQKPTWSEEDELVVEDIEEAVINYWHGQSQEDLLDWLKSLKTRCTWKPSDEQMEALDDFIYAKYPNIEKYGVAVKSLYQDLKKLREE